MGVENGMFSFEIGTGIGESGGTSVPRIPRSTSSGVLNCNEDQ